MPIDNKDTVCETCNVIGLVGAFYLKLYQLADSALPVFCNAIPMLILQSQFLHFTHPCETELKLELGLFNITRIGFMHFEWFISVLLNR